MSQFLAAIAAIPKIIEFVIQFAKFMQNTFGDNWDKFLPDLNDTFKKLNEAKTPDEKRNAADNLSKLARRLGG